MLLILLAIAAACLLVFLLLGASVFALGATLMLIGAVLAVVGLVLILFPRRLHPKGSIAHTRTIGLVLLLACPVLLTIGDSITGTVVR